MVYSYDKIIILKNIIRVKKNSELLTDAFSNMMDMFYIIIDWLLKTIIINNWIKQKPKTKANRNWKNMRFIIGSKKCFYKL